MFSRVAAAIVAVFALTAPAHATGMMGNDAPSRIPVPAKVFSATVEDAAGVTMDLNRVTFNGEVFIYGRIGEGTASVPFEKIREARVEPSTDPSGDKLIYIMLLDGTSVRLVVESDVPCYGEAGFGNYKLEVDKLRRITFKHPPADPPKATQEPSAPAE